MFSESKEVTLFLGFFASNADVMTVEYLANANGFSSSSISSNDLLSVIALNNLWPGVHLYIKYLA